MHEGCSILYLITAATEKDVMVKDSEKAGKDVADLLNSSLFNYTTFSDFVVSRAGDKLVIVKQPCAQV